MGSLTVAPGTDNSFGAVRQQRLTGSGTQRRKRYYKSPGREFGIPWECYILLPRQIRLLLQGGQNALYVFLRSTIHPHDLVYYGLSDHA